VHDVTLPPPVVILDFRAPGSESLQGPTLFRDPACTIVAEKLADVREALREAERQSKAGRHIAGFLSYDAAPAFDDALVVREGSQLPLVWLGAFEVAETWEEPKLDSTALQIPAWSPLLSREEYDGAIESIRRAIAEGSVYQVNHTIRLRAPAPEDPLALWLQLRRAQRARYAAFIDIGSHQILSVSPELFFERSGDHIVTRPMKGTAPRGRWLEEDDRLAAELSSSEKERAENVMIVDLLRNDLGRVARPGSVHVRTLFDVERYPTVLQLTSTVEATLDRGVTLERVMASLFPCGSITGAPKVAATRMIASLEDEPRGVYCGAIGHVAPGHPTTATFNVAIRTIHIDRSCGRMEYGVGGGITWDSTAHGELDELLTKAAVLTAERPTFELLETMRLEAGRVRRLDRHLSRLERSSRYFGYASPLAGARATLESLARELSSDVPWRIRLLADEAGRVRVEHTRLPATPRAARVALAAAPVSRHDVFLHHKTTHRTSYDARRKEWPGVFDVLLSNEEGELTEFTIGNLVVELDGSRCTPPRDCGLLAGIFREELLDGGEIRERILRAEDLGHASRVWLINSVREWVPVTVDNGSDLA
jgi:para-aminobenzoate synthetase / 4-amino-4-deoxychorismate lyase